MVHFPDQLEIPFNQATIIIKTIPVFLDRISFLVSTICELQYL